MPLLKTGSKLVETESAKVYSNSPMTVKEWIGSILGPVHDNGIGPKHTSYLFCDCNLGKIARFKECGISHFDWMYLWNWI